MRIFIPLLIIPLLMTSCQNKPELVNARYIDPFICTEDDHGQTDVAAAIPFGMVKPCPDTDPIGHSGYDFNSNEIFGFSHTRFSGVGCRGVGGNIRVLPFANKDTIPQKLSYNKNSEVAKPGYYEVVLEEGIHVKLTATNKVAFHSYIFPESDKSGIVVDLSSSFEGHISEQHQFDESGILYGKVESVNVCQLGKYSFYFAFCLDKAETGVYNEGSKVIYNFKTSEGEKVKAYCALSVINEEQAISNLKKDMELSFVNVRNKAFEQWNDLMNVVEVQTDDTVAKRLFYTHLYHATQSPFLISEDDGTYRGSDGNLYQSRQIKHYHGWSIWDTFRSKLPLLSFLYPELYSKMTASIGELYKQGKPDWATETEPFITIRTEHSIIVLLEAYRKGLLTFPLEEIYPLLKKEVEHLPFKTPDNVLESSYDLWAFSEIAKKLGNMDDYYCYKKKAYQYKEVWKEKFMVIDEKSDIMHGDGLYEGTLWQYRWFVPFDIKGIQELVSGKDTFEQQLDQFFEEELFNIGNQPDIQVPYLYAYTNSPWKTQKVVHTLLNEVTNNWYGTHNKWKKPMTRKIFQDSPKGYIKEMDDDAGTMSAWYVWSCLGLYPVFPGSTEMVISTPQFENIKIKLPKGFLEIESIKPSAESIYIQKIEINGENWNSGFIDFNLLSDGGKILIELGEIPNKSWGVVNKN